MVGQVRRALAARNGGPGITAAELAAELDISVAYVRHAFTVLVFTERIATCDAEGRHRLGDPTALLRMGA